MSQTVLITGISGWIAQYCAKEALELGYKVKGSLRTMSRENDVRDALKSYVKKKDDLSFCKLDLLEDVGWDNAMQDCSYVLHVASPFVIREPKNEEELIKPAKEGTLRCLEAAKKAKIKRVVVTSSIAAMMGHMKSGAFNETSWTDLNSKQPTAYQRSKTIAEKAAWDFYHQQKEDEKLELAVVNPGAVFGPNLGKDLDGVSMEIPRKLLKGEMPGIPNINFVMADVRDVAKHHLQAMVVPEANGKRFISSHAKPNSFLDIAHILKNAGHKKVPTNRVPSFILKLIGLIDKETKSMAKYVDCVVSCDNSQTIKLFNWTPIPLKQTIEDMGESIQAIISLEK